MCRIENQFLANAIMPNKSSSGSYKTCHQLCLLIYSYCDRFNIVYVLQVEDWCILSDCMLQQSCSKSLPISQ